MLTENLGLKVSAVLIAALLWFFVTSRGQSELSVDVPVEFKNIPAGLEISFSSAKTVVLTVRGQERLIRNFRATDARVSVDLGKARKGEGTYYVDKEGIKLPFAMTVMNADPSAIRVRLEETITRTVPVVPSLTGVPARGLSVGAVVIDPPNVTVKGLKSEVRKIEAVKTEEFDVTGLRETVTQELNIDTGGVNVSPKPESVKVKIAITGGKR